MRLEYDLYDVYGQKIVAKGCEITGQVVRGIIKRGELLPKKEIPVGRTLILKDFKKVLRDRRYHKIFRPQKIQVKILKTFSRLNLSEPIILELRKMKAHLSDTYHHVLVMAALVIKMIQDIKARNYDPVHAARLCLTHDIGKTRIPNNILNKKSPLTASEYRIIKTHPLIGFLLMTYYRGWAGKQFSKVAFEHHEKLDGTGYPRGISKIDRYAQLIAPVDIYDALISKRPYRKMAYNGRLAIDILLEDARKGKLNKKSVYLLINCIRNHKVAALSQLKVSQKRREKYLSGGNVYGRVKRKRARSLLKSD